MLEPTFTGKLDFLLLYGGLIWPLFFVLVRFGGWPSTHAINSRALRVAGLLLAGVLISGALTGWDPGRWGLSRSWLALLLWAQAIGHTGILVWACGWAPRTGEASGKGPPSRSRDTRWLLFLFAALVACGFTITELQTRKRDALLRAELLTRAQLGAVAISTEGLAALPGTESDTQLPEYQRLKRKLTELHEAIPHNRFTYLCRQRGKDVIILADSEPPTSKDYSPPGQVYAEASDGLKRSLSEHMQAIENYQDRWGEWVSGFVPLNLPNHLASVSFGLDEEATYWRDQIALERRVPGGVSVPLPLHRLPKAEGQSGPGPGPRRGGAAGQPRQERLPRHHESRDPHPHERDPRDDGNVAAIPLECAAAGTGQHYQPQRQGIARHHQRHSRSRED